MFKAHSEIQKRYLKLACFALVLTTIECAFNRSTLAQVGVEASPQAVSSSHCETADFSRVVSRITEIAKRKDPATVLFVVDIDNTLLAMDQDLGSDQWFNWQESLLRTAPNSRHLVADDFPGLLRAQGLLFALSEMHCPEPGLAKNVGQILDAGCHALVLTSRGPNFRDATERELARNGYQFATRSLQIKENARGQFLPYDPASAGQHGLSAEEMESLGKPGEVSYSSGVFMVAGQHKGFMLRTLLARSTQKIGTIVFVDDHEKHTTRMKEAFAKSGVDVITFRYSREDGNVLNFNDSDKSRVTRKWRQLNSAIRQSLVH